MNQPTPDIDKEPPTVETYQVVFRGIQPSAIPSKAKANLVALFKTSSEQIDKLVALPSYVVKKSVTFDMASRYKQAIEAAGGVCDLIPEAAKTKSDAMAVPDVRTPTNAAMNQESHVVAVSAPSSRDTPMAKPPAVSPTADKAKVEDSDPGPVVEQSANKAMEDADEKAWWFAFADQQIGPISIGRLRGALKSGSVLPTDMVWKEGMPGWQLASNIDALSSGDASQTAVPPPLTANATEPSTSSGIDRTMNSILEAVNPVISKIEARMKQASKREIYIGGGIAIGVVVIPILAFQLLRSEPPACSSKEAVYGIKNIVMGQLRNGAGVDSDTLAKMDPIYASATSALEMVTSDGYDKETKMRSCHAKWSTAVIGRTWSYDYEYSIQKTEDSSNSVVTINNFMAYGYSDLNGAIYSEARRLANNGQ